MRWEGNRESDNVEDRRSGGGGMGGRSIGIGTVVIALIAWGVFGVLLWGRWRFGWRGRTAIRWTLSGFVFLALAYFGSKLVLELVLQRY